MDIENYFEIGYITKTRGLKGEVQVNFTFDQPEKLKIKSVFIEISKKLVPYFVANYKIPMPMIGYFNFEDIDHIDKIDDEHRHQSDRRDQCHDRHMPEQVPLDKLSLRPSHRPGHPFCENIPRGFRRV
jgi:hypothetical protein